MPYVYKYTDVNDDTVKYVGIIKKDTNFPNRFFQHYRDKWYKEGKWRIEYISVDSVTDAETLEAHFICIYGTSDYFNKAKTEWGKCSFAPDPNEYKWTVYEEGRCMTRSLTDRTQKILDELYSIDRRQKELWHEYDIIEKWVDQEMLASIREWVSERIVLPENVCFTWQRDHSLTVSIKSYEYLFENYLAWAELHESISPITITSVEEFENAINRNSHLRNFCAKDGVPVIVVGSDEYYQYKKIRDEIDKEDRLKIAEIFGLKA